MGTLAGSIFRSWGKRNGGPVKAPPKFPARGRDSGEEGRGPPVESRSPGLQNPAIPGTPTGKSRPPVGIPAIGVHGESGEAPIPDPAALANAPFLSNAPFQTGPAIRSAPSIKVRPCTKWRIVHPVGSVVGGGYLQHFLMFSARKVERKSENHQG